jgi:hypothetical protein
VRGRREKIKLGKFIKTASQIMKLTYLILSLFISLNTFAAEYAAIGKNIKGQTIMLNESSDGFVITVQNRRDRDPVEKYLLAEECPGNMWAGLKCSPNGRSPLSGATYKRCYLEQTKGKKIREICSNDMGNKNNYFRCVKGCNSKRIPKILSDMPWEEE